jgi:uncharacterized protein
MSRILSFSPSLSDFFAEYGFAAGDLGTTVAHGITPLMRAAQLGREDLVSELVSLGADVHSVNHDGNTALWLGCFSGSPDVVRRLAQAGSHLNHQNAVGATCLMYAASSGKAHIIQVLLELGSDPLVRNQDGGLAGEMAQNLECLKLLRHTIS